MSKSMQVSVAGAPLHCRHCEGAEFRTEKTLLDTSGFGLGVLVLGGWLWSHQATVYACTTCGFVHWFFQTEGVVHEVTESTATSGATSKTD